MDGHEAKRRHDLVIALRRVHHAVENLHEARVLVHEHSPECADFGSHLIFELEKWQADVKALLEPH